MTQTPIDLLKERMQRNVRPESRVYLLTYDRHEGGDYEPLLNLLREIPYVQGSESAYFFSSLDTIPHLRQLLGKYFTRSEKWHIVRVRSQEDCAGQLSPQAIQWLKVHLPVGAVA